jgi:hypothetical protein
MVVAHWLYLVAAGIVIIAGDPSSEESVAENVYQRGQKSIRRMSMSVGFDSSDDLLSMSSDALSMQESSDDATEKKTFSFSTQTNSLDITDATWRDSRTSSFGPEDESPSTTCHNGGQKETISLPAPLSEYGEEEDDDEGDIENGKVWEA